MAKGKRLAARRPAETAAPTIWGALTGLMVAFGVDVNRALAISGFVGMLTPIVVTWWVSRRKDEVVEVSIP